MRQCLSDNGAVVFRMAGQREQVSASEQLTLGVAKNRRLKAHTLGDAPARRQPLEFTAMLDLVGADDKQPPSLGADIGEGLDQSSNS